MNTDLAQDAINAALSGNWEQALLVNQEILKDNKNDIDALNRSARAHAELGDIQKAREIVKQVLSIDPFNSIAQKALDRWKGVKKGDIVRSGPSSAHVFLEEPGKTKIVGLINLGGQEVLGELDAGDEVRLNCNSHKISVQTLAGKFIGRLPDDLSARVRNLSELGYEYTVYVKSVDKTEVKVFIRELKRPTKYIDIPSFPAEKMNYVSFTPPELLSQQDADNDSDAETEEL